MCLSPPRCSRVSLQDSTWSNVHVCVCVSVCVCVCVCVVNTTYSQDSTWSETGDRYLLKLFRDFVFFQRVPEGSPGAGGPLLDWGYVIEALNKVRVYGCVCVCVSTHVSTSGGTLSLFFCVLGSTIHSHVELGREGHGRQARDRTVTARARALVAVLHLCRCSQMYSCVCACVCSQLDSGVSERIMLLSRDEAAMLIASYADIKRCVEAAYAGLQGRGQGTAGTGAGSSTQHQTGSTPSFKPP